VASATLAPFVLKGPVEPFYRGAGGEYTQALPSQTSALMH